MVTDNTSQADDTTAFLRAARSGNLEKVVEFLDTDLDINTANSNGLNALHLASKDGHVEIVTELLKRGAKVDAATKKGNTALHIASLAGQAEIVTILIQYGAAVNIQSQNGFTPLYMAAQENHDQVVKILLNNEANQSLATEDGFTPLAVAMQQGHDKVVSVLLENDSKGRVRLPALHIAAKKDDCKAADLLLQNDHKPDVTSKSGFTPLHIAAHYGNEEIARLLIKRGADVNYLAKHNISPLHVAAKWGKNNMVKVLLENHAQIDAKTRDGLTPLHCAARSGHEQVVTTLLENAAPISARTKNGLAPLHMASQGDHVEAARVLLYHRAPVDEVTIDYLTSLHVAAHCGHVRVAKLLLDRKADPNARALNGFTPLHIACKKNRIKVVELLLKHGASIESTTESGLTPLHVASFMGCMNIVIFLLQHEANPDVPTVRGETPLHLAARANQTDIIRILLRNGAKVDARAREQQTPLHIASRLGNIDIVMLLLQHGAAVDTTTKDMYTALHIAAKEGQEEVANILVENNASLKATTKNGFTPLHVAAKYGNMNVAKILLQKESKLDAQGKNDITPLHMACHYDHSNVANLLLEKGASPHLASQNGHTPLHIAARKNQMDIASTLLENGANANAESKAGFTPLHLSAQKGHYDMTNLLIEHGADPNHKAKNGLTALHLCAQEDFIRVASILVKNGADLESQTETGYRPIHVAAHFGNLSMIRFLLKHNAEIDVNTNQNYTPLHQAAQQGHAHIVTALLEGNASHRARTKDGLTALNIAQKLGYISVMEVLKGLSYDTSAPDNKNWEEKYRVIAPESLQETSFMSDSDDEGASDALISEQPYRYLTADLMKSLRDDSLPIDVTRDDPIQQPVTKEEKQEFVQSNNYCLAENFDSTDGLNLGRLHFRSFLVSFLVDARGGAMKGCRHSGVRIIVPPRRATMPMRVTCKLVKPSKVPNPPPLMEGEALATRVIEMGPVGATFLGPVLIDIPHFASIRGKEREIIILRSENGETWKEHDNSVDNDDTLLNTPYDPQMGASHSGRITRILTTEFPQYFAIITRIKQEVHVIGAEGGILISSVANHVQAVFPPGALTKKIKVGLQAHVIPAELTAKLLGNCVAVSPVITIEPRRRKFHKPITLTIPVPQAANKGMINQYGGETPTLRLLCSIAGGTSESQWEDVTGSTPLTFMNDRVSFTTTVSARFWLMDCRNIEAVPKMATELYEESLFVPYITNFVIYSKRMDILEATLRILCMTDGKEGIHTLEKQEEFFELVKSRDVEALDGKDLYIEFSGNLVPVTKSGVQLKFTFKAFRQNRLSFHVKVKDPLLDSVARMLFMREPKVAKGDPPQQPICVLNIVLPEITAKSEIKLKLKEDYEDSNIISQKMDSLKSQYKLEGKEKYDVPKDASPTEQKFITDTLQKEQTDAATIHDSLAQKAACPLESVDASYPNKVGGQEQDLSPTVEKQTYSEKRKFWEDISRKRDSYQRSESELSRASQLTTNESDSENVQNLVTEDDATEMPSELVSEVVKSETMEDINVPDISECSVAEKAHYFEEQIQKEMAKVPAKVPQQPEPIKSEKDKPPKGKSPEEEKTIEKVEMVTTEITKEKIEGEEKHVKELKEVEKVVEKFEEKQTSREYKQEEDSWKEEIQQMELKQIKDKDRKDVEKPVTDEKDTDESKEASDDSSRVTSQPVMEVCKELLNKERELAEKSFETEVVVGSEKVATAKEEITESETTIQDVIKERKDISGKGREPVGGVFTEEEIMRPVEPETGTTEDEPKAQETQPTAHIEEAVDHKAEVKKDGKHSASEAELETVKHTHAELKEPEASISLDEKPETLERKAKMGKRVITEETTIVYKVQKDGTLVQEQITKSVQIQGENGTSVTKVPEVSVETKMYEKSLPETLQEIQSIDAKAETVPLGVKKEVQEFLESERRVQEGDTSIQESVPEGEITKTEYGTIIQSHTTEEAPGLITKVEEIITKQIIETKGAGEEKRTIVSTTKPLAETEIKQIKKEFESRIPISTTKSEKDKTQKDGKPKTPQEGKPSDKSENGKTSEIHSPEEVTSPLGKKKEFESRIPKRIIDTKSSEKGPKKDVHLKKESETITVTEKKSSEEVTSKHEEHLTTKRETQTFSKTFTDPQEAFKMFEDMESMKKDFATVTSKVDHKTSSKLETKQVVSSEISTGTDKIITHEEKERVERKKSSESKLKKESADEKLEEKRSKHEEIDRTAVQKMSLNLSDGKEVIDASAAESRAESKKEETYKTLEGEEGISTHETGSSRIRESDADVAIRIKRDASETTDDQDSIGTMDDITEKSSRSVLDMDKVEMVSKGESHRETRDSYDVKHFTPSEKAKKKAAEDKDDRVAEEETDAAPVAEERTVDETKKKESSALPSLEEMQQQKFKEIEARTIAETLIQSIESEIEKRSPTELKTEFLSKGYLEQVMADISESDHEKLADDLTRKFEIIMQKTAEDQSARVKENISMILDKMSARDSISISEDITREESSHEKEESLPLSLSQVRFPDRDITMSPSSISEPIDFEETIDVDTNVLEEIIKPTSETPQSEDRTSQQSTGPVEPRVAFEISGARVLEIIEPGADSQSRQDSMDVPSLEMDEHRVSEPTSKGIPSLHESIAVDSLERIGQDRDLTMSPTTVSEDINLDYSMTQEQGPPSLTQKDYESDMKRADSFEIDSPPLVSPRTKAPGLQIKPVNWMIGDEKIEISETLQPSQVFNQELEEYESSLKQKSRLPSQEGSIDLEQESATKSSEDISVIESVKETTSGTQITVPVTESHRFTVVVLDEQSHEPISEPASESISEAVNDPDFESDLIENKLEVSCQELVETLQREYEAKTPTDEYAAGLLEGMTQEEIAELERRVSEDLVIQEQLREEEDWEQISEHEEDKVEKSEEFQIMGEEVQKQEHVEVGKIEEDRMEKHVVEPPKKDEAEKEKVKEEEVTEISTEVSETIPKEGTETADQEVPQSVSSTKQEEITETSVIPEDSQEHEVEKEKPKGETTRPDVELKLEKTAQPRRDDEKQSDEASKEGGDAEVPKSVDNVLKDWTEAYLSKVKAPTDDYRRHMEKSTDKHDSPGRSVPSDTGALKKKKEELPSVDLSARYAITVLDQVVKKEIAEVKESLEAAKQDLIEELSENSETVIQIKDSPSEFQFKLQPESIPNDLPFLYRPPSPEHTTAERGPDGAQSDSFVPEAENYEKTKEEVKKVSESKVEAKQSISSSIEESDEPEQEQAPAKAETEPTITVQHEIKKEDEHGRSSPVFASKSGSDPDNKDESSLAPPPPVMRRRHKPARTAVRRVTSDSEAEASSGDSSYYQSCEYDIGSGSRPSSSDVEAMHSAAFASATASEYETAMMSGEHTSTSRPTSQEYQTAASTLSSRESMKSLQSLSSGHLGSIDSTSELSETLVASEPEGDKDEADEHLALALGEDPDHSESSESEIPLDEPLLTVDDKIDSHVPGRMKRSSEMIFQQIIDDNAMVDTESAAESVTEPAAELVTEDAKGVDSATSAFAVAPGAVQSVDIMTSRVSEDGTQSVCTQVTSTQMPVTTESETLATETELASSDSEALQKDIEATMEMPSMEPDSLEPRSSLSGFTSDSPEMTVQTSGLSMMQQASMSTSSTSGVSIDTVIEKEKTDRHSPDSDSFELVDKPDIIDDFVVIEEVGREAEEFDSEGKSIRISTMPQVPSKQYDQDLENLIAATKEETQVSTSQTSKNNELFDFESEESPPQASNEDQYSQSYSDEEQYENKKWVEMQFQAEARVYELEYDRGPLEDIKEEEITDFEPGSSRFGSLGSHKESIGSVGSMRGSFGSTPEFDVLAGRKYFTRPADQDNVSLSSLQEFEHLESTVGAEAKVVHCGSQDSINNGSLPRRYRTSRSGHGDDISLSSLKDFEGLERACREAHLIELRAREEEDLLEHESPENKFKVENLPRTKTETSAAGSFNPSTSGSDDYDRRIKEIDEIIRIAQANVERADRQDDTMEDISQIEITDAEKERLLAGGHLSEQPVLEQDEPEEILPQREGNIMETSTDSLELEANVDKKQHPLYRSSDSLEMKTTLDVPSLSSDSLNNVKDPKETYSDAGEQASSMRRMSSDSLEMAEPQGERQGSSSDHSVEGQSDPSMGQTPSTEKNVQIGKTRDSPDSGT